MKNSVSQYILVTAFALAGLSAAHAGDVTTIFGTYYGGFQSLNFESAHDVTVDNLGNVYVVGETNASNFPVSDTPVFNAPGAGIDAFLLKFSPTGTLLFASRFGGDGSDRALSVDTDTGGRVYVAGETDSTDFPKVNARQGAPGGNVDGFIFAVNTSGTQVLFSDYFGGSDADSILDIAATSPSNICVCGKTRSGDFPTANAEQASKPSTGLDDAFVACMDAVENVLSFSTFLGGATGLTEARSLAIDSMGRIVVGGTTRASDFPAIVGGLQNTFLGIDGAASAFITRYLSNGLLAYATFLGGSIGDSAINAVETDTIDRILVGGETRAADFPTVPSEPFPGASPSGFFAQLNPNGASLAFSEVFAMDLTTPRETVVNDIAVVPGRPMVAVGTTTQGVDRSWFYQVFDGTNTASIFISSPTDASGLGAALDASGAVHVAGQSIGGGIAGRTLNAVQSIPVNNVDAYVFKESNTFLGTVGEGEGEGGICPLGCFFNSEGDNCLCPEGEGEGELPCVIPSGFTDVAALSINGPNIGESASFTAQANGSFLFTAGDAAINFNVVHNASEPVSVFLFDGVPLPSRANQLVDFLLTQTCGNTTPTTGLSLPNSCKLLAGDLWLLLETASGDLAGGQLLPGTSTATCNGTGEGEPEAETNEGEPLLPCATLCPGNGIDMDGDGLDVACEACLGSSDLNPDNDGDGMPDNFERNNGLDPDNPADGLTDKDGDGISNLKEYLIGSDPCDPDSPGSVRFVSTDGVDSVGGGSAANPWRTIGFGLTQIANLGINSARLRVFPGVYAEDLSLLSGVTISGPECDLDDPGLDLDDCAVIQGEVTGTNGATLEDVVIQQDGPNATLLQMNNVTMRALGVIFLGDESRTATGVQAMGSNAGNSILERCDFAGLSTGVDVFDSIPIIRLCFFTAHTDTYIRFRTTLVKQASTNGLGSRNNPNSGFNRFDSPGQGDLQAGAVVNERAETISMEGNEWGTQDPAEIDALIAGPADFEPFLAAGAALLAGSVFVTVWNAEDQQPIVDASVSLAISPYDPVTDNEQGVYPFVAVEESQYTVTATADGFDPGIAFIDVDAGELVSVVVPLGGVVIPPECGCGVRPGGRHGSLGDIVVVLSALAILIALRGQSRGTALWTAAARRRSQSRQKPH